MAYRFWRIQGIFPHRSEHSFYPQIWFIYSFYFSWVHSTNESIRFITNDAKTLGECMELSISSFWCIKTLRDSHECKMRPLPIQMTVEKVKRYRNRYVHIHLQNTPKGYKTHQLLLGSLLADRQSKRSHPLASNAIKASRHILTVVLQNMDIEL